MARATKKTPAAKRPQQPQITASVDPQLKAAAAAYAKKNGMTVSTLIVSAILERLGSKVKDRTVRRARNGS